MEHICVIEIEVYLSRSGRNMVILSIRQLEPHL